MRSPYHRIAQWTGSHFAPTSLYSLGFMLCLGHSGKPCPLTVEVLPSYVTVLPPSLTCTQGIQAAKELIAEKKKPKVPSTAPLQDAPTAPPPPLSLDVLSGISDNLFDLSKSFPTEKDARRTRKTKSANPLLTVVNQTGVFDMEVLTCICPNGGKQDEQLLQAGLFPSSFKQIETVFTFSVLDEFLADNLECKTTAQQYYSKLQIITNRMFPHNVPVCVFANDHIS